MRVRYSLGGLFASLATVFLFFGAVQAQDNSKVDLQHSTWQQITSSGKIRMGVVQYAPYWVRDTASGTWSGAMVEMGKSIAKDLGVELVLQETTWSNFILDLQANKIDFMMAVSATPERAKVVDFVGPMYELNFTMINRPGFEAKTWDDYNKSDVRIAVVTGSSGTPVLDRFTPNAQHVKLSKLGETLLAVMSKRADAALTTTIAGLQARAQNPDLGEMITPLPLQGLPSYAVLRYEIDPRFRGFLAAWGTWNRTLGNMEKWIKDSLQLVGVTEVPTDVRF